MFKAIIFTTIFAGTALQATAESDTEYNLSNLPAEVAARVAHLQQFGNRFEPAIHAILAEVEKPVWNGGTSTLSLRTISSDTAFESDKMNSGSAANEYWQDPCGGPLPQQLAKGA